METLSKAFRIKSCVPPHQSADFMKQAITIGQNNIHLISDRHVIFMKQVTTTGQK